MMTTVVIAIAIVIPWLPSPRARFLKTSASSANIPPTVLEHQPQNRYLLPPPTIQRNTIY